MRRQRGVPGCSVHSVMPSASLCAYLTAISSPQRLAADPQAAPKPPTISSGHPMTASQKLRGGSEPEWLIVDLVHTAMILVRGMNHG